MTAINSKSSPYNRRLRIIIWISLSLVLFISIINLCFQVYGDQFLSISKVSWQPMKSITALIFIISVLVLSVQQTGLPGSVKRALSIFFAALISGESILLIYIHVYYFYSGNESLLTQISVFDSLFSPNNLMPFLTSCNFLLVGIILLLLSENKKKPSDIAHVLTVPVFLVSYFIIIRFLLIDYSTTEFRRVPTSPDTGIAFCGLLAVILLMRPGTWLFKLIFSPDTAGIITRKLLPALIILPIIIGWMRIHGEHIGLFKSEEGVVFVAVAYTTCFLVLIWLTAQYIEKTDSKRRSVEKLLKESEEKLWSVLNATQESIYMFDRNGIITMSNYTGMIRLNISSEDKLIGHHFTEFMIPDIARSRQEKLEEVFTSGKPIEFEDDRECRIYHHNFFPVYKDDKVLFVVTYSSDITESKRAEAELKESEDRFRTIAESLTVMISIERICDATLTFANEPFEKTFGYGKNELIGKKVPDGFYSPDDFIGISNNLKETGTINNKEIRVKKSDGSELWIMLSVRKINFMNELSYLSALIDITESKSTQLELLRLNRTLDAQSKSSQAMIHSNNELNYINAVCKIVVEDCGHTMVWIGYAQNDEYKNVEPVAYYGFDKGYIEQLNITWDDTERGRGPTGTAIRTGKLCICKNMLTDPAFKPWRRAARERGYASSLVLPLISEGKPFGALSIYSKEPDPFSEPEIKLLSELADDLAYGISFIRLTESERAATRAIKENEAKLKELIDTKDKFFNIIAHDLKNPFTSLLGSSELLFDNINRMSVENIRDLALILNDSAKSGFAILQNLLDWSRSQTGMLKFNPEETNLKIIIDENIDNIKLQVKNKGIKLKSKLTDDLLIFADKNMINTILRNLLSNAVKYTFKNGTIHVSVSRAPEEIIITVRDTGTGISKEKVDTLFKIENSISQPGTEKEQGTGLGLKLCKEFTEKMGGRIWVESIVGQGSEFKFTIPLDGINA
ncbi:MAG: ATP-binding protein [Bacteroidales bacterium]